MVRPKGKRVLAALVLAAAGSVAAVYLEWTLLNQMTLILRVDAQKTLMADSRNASAYRLRLRLLSNVKKAAMKRARAQAYSVEKS